MGVNKKDYIERTLISLKRRYSKDETVAALIKELKEKDIEIGKLSAEIDYLQNELQSDNEQKEINKLAKIEARKDEMYKFKLIEGRKQQKKIQELRRLNADLIAKLNANSALDKANLEGKALPINIVSKSVCSHEWTTLGAPGELMGYCKKCMQPRK